MSAIPRSFTLLGTGAGGTPTFNGWTSTGTGVFTSAATAGLQLYNTADQTTDYTRLQMFWSGNVAYISSGIGGSGTRRQMQIIAGDGVGSGNNAGMTISALTAFPAVSIFARQQAMNDANFNVLTVGAGNASYVGTSGTNSILAITPTYNQASGTAANTDLLINRTQTAVGSGAQRLLDMQVGGTSRFYTLNTGFTYLGSASNVGGIGDLSQTSRYAWDASGTVICNSAGSAAITIVASTSNASFSGALITTPQALSGAGAVNVTTSATEYTSTGAAQALTLANGTAGQIKTITHVVDGGSGVLTPTTALGYTTITFTNAGESAVLQYTSAGWVILSLRGAVAA